MIKLAIAAVIALSMLNAFTFAAFWVDKNAARNGQRRTRESTLLMLAALGGSLGAIAGQKILRHKTRKEPFRSRMATIIGLQFAVALIASGYFWL